MTRSGGIAVLIPSFDRLANTALQAACWSLVAGLPTLCGERAGRNQLIRPTYRRRRP